MRKIAAFFLVAACSGTPSAPKKDKETPPPATKPAPATVKVEPKSEPVSKPVESAPAAPSSVVFVVDNQMAIPLACFDASTKSFIDEKDANANCAKMVQASQQLKLSTNAGTTLQAQSEWVCEPAEFKKIAFPIDPKLPDNTMTQLGVFPPTTPAVFVQAVGETKFTADPADVTPLQEAIKKAAPTTTKGMRVHQIARFDIDGDTKEDTFFSVTVAGKNMADDTINSIENEFGFSGVFMRLGSKPEEIVLLKQATISTFEIRGFVDLNGDGRKEILISDSMWEGFGINANEIMPDGTLKQLGDWGCGA